MEVLDDLAAAKEKELVELRQQQQQHVTQTIKSEPLRHTSGCFVTILFSFVCLATSVAS